MPKVLVIEDQAEASSFLEPELPNEGYEVDAACAGRAGLEKIENGKQAFFY
jgi:DNA-binding response OmpR family regulator